ncbi:MAG: succinylglutamate desuccinylase/aspartoacylase family protein, partial [Candidatus Nanohaloarchaea archaeon]
MKVYTRGTGRPEYAVTGLVHGDEPAGRRAIEKFLEEDHEFRKPVKFVVANEKAAELGERYVDDDLNRVFPGDSGSDSHEKRLASRIMEEVEGLKLLDLHTTRSYPQPFATFSNKNEVTEDLLRSVGVPNAVHFPDDSGTLNEQVNGLVVETGFQGTAMAAENALGVLKNFLAAQNVIDLEYGRLRPEIFRHFETVEGNWRFTARNFRKVREGEIYARKEDKVLKAEKDFYPVLMSGNGYSDMLGFKAKKTDT